VERLLSQNKFHFRQIAYKNYPVDLDEYKSKQSSANNYNPHSIYSENNGDEENKNQDNMNDEEVNLIKNIDSKPKLKPLFQYSGKNVLEGCKYVVNSMDWNPYNKDLLAASYGDHDIDSKKEGLLLFWTLKNPLHPERVIKTNRGITSCHFSTKNPFLIAAADYSGEIMIYDLRTSSDRPVADSTEQKEKHTDIVWDVKWVEKQNDKNEMLVSISSDGKVKEWSLKKGLEVGDLLKMKKTISLPDKTLSPFSKYGKSNKDSLVFRDANGLSFDFPRNDSTVYYISLEECTIHR
jgi:WD40 repeat protein